MKHAKVPLCMQITTICFSYPRGTDLNVYRKGFSFLSPFLNISKKNNNNLT